MKRILLVEDNPDNRDLVFAFLDALYDIRACVDGFEALEALAPNSGYRPDLLLCDISLPGMDGVELLRTLRQDPRLAGIPAIALTSHAMKGDQERFLAAGFDAYVSKPITDETILLDAIERLLSHGQGG
ncbi:MAG TPA: response regulator [Candidatus Competibacteraceae bacterium]|nr:response regulator [Candidatus Competibacteraceae bacterium]